MRIILLGFCLFSLLIEAQSQNCAASYTRLSDQFQIDSFFENNSGCSVINGSIEIREYVKSSIRDLTGLSHIKVIKGDLIIKSNLSLEGLGGLEGIDSIYGSLIILDNDSLISTEAFNQIQYVGRSVHLRTISIWVDGFNALDSVKSIFLELPEATSFSSFPKVKHLDSLQVLANHLVELNGFNILEAVDYIKIYNGDSLRSLTALRSVKKIRNIDITHCASLRDLTDFVSLAVVTGEISIIYNKELVSLEGLEGIDLDSVDKITIADNESLTQCSIGWVCELLNNPNMLFDIRNNQSGCHSFFEIISACGTTCPTHLHFSTQAEINSFPVLFPGCESIPGNLTIDDTSLSGIFNVDSLYAITSIGQDLNILSNPMLTDLSGLRNIESIGGDVTISDNEALTTLDGLDKITILRDLKIEFNQSMVSLAGLQHLREVRNLQLGWLSQISTLNLNELQRISGDFQILGNLGTNSEFPPLLDTILGKLILMEVFFAVDFSAPTALKSIGGLDLYNTNLTSMAAFSNLAEINGDISLTLNRHLESLGGMESLGTISGNIVIENNAKLKDLRMFSNIPSVKGNLYILKNELLENLMDLSIVSEIEGKLWIYNNVRLVSLSGLDQLTRIGSDLEINYNSKLHDLSGLQALESIGGSLVLTGNINLSGFAGLEKVTSIPGDFKISNCAATDFTGMGQLSSIGDTLYVSSNSFVSLDGLDSLRSAGQISLLYNDNLENFNAFNNLRELTSGIRILLCKKLTHLPLLYNIDTIHGDLILDENRLLLDLSGLDSIQVIHGSLVLSKNYDLASLQGLGQLRSIGNQMIIARSSVSTLEPLEGLEHIDGKEGIGPVVQIVMNSYLKDCSIPPMCQLIQDGQEILIEDNLRGCDNQVQVEFSCHKPFICNRTNIALYTQTMIDSFNFLFPGCGIIKGNLLVTEQVPGTILRLDSLSKVYEIGGTLNIFLNTQLSTLHGLENLDVVGGGIVLDRNEKLEDIEALSGINLDKLGKISYTEYELSIIDNNNLSFCAYPFMCDLLSRPELSKLVFSNKPGCSTQTQIRAGCDYPVRCRLDTIFDSYDLITFPVRFPSCTTLEGSLVILASINDLTPLLQLEHIEGEIYLDGGNIVTALHGLENVTSIAGPITLKNQLWLNDITALGNIDPGSIRTAEGNYHILIENNRYLSSCAAQPICEALSSSPEKVIIHDNLAGCDTQEEVRAQCLVGTVQNDQLLGITLYPNPTSGEIHIETSFEGEEQLKTGIFDHTGLKVYEGNFSSTLSLENLYPGIYTIVFSSPQCKRAYRRILLLGRP